MTENDSELAESSEDSPETDAATAQIVPISVNLEHIPDNPLENLQDETSLARQRLNAMSLRVNQLVPLGSEVHVTFTGDFPTSVTTRVTSGEVQEPYTMERGASVVAGRTMRRTDDGFDILFDVYNLFSFANETEQEVEATTANALHLASHEPQHVWLSHTLTEAENYQDLVDADPTAFRFRKMIASAIDEYRCERAANAYEATQPSKSVSIAHDLEHFRGQLNSSHAICNDDTYEACYQVMTAAGEFIKALAYLAAELPPFSSESPVARPEELPEGWSRYVEPIWPMICQVLSLLPAANEATTIEHLATVDGMLCKLVVTWLQLIGIDYSYDADAGEACYWTAESY
jgi:hypothetical protein